MMCVMKWTAIQDIVNSNLVRDVKHKEIRIVYLVENINYLNLGIKRLRKVVRGVPILVLPLVIENKTKEKRGVKNAK